MAAGDYGDQLYAFVYGNGVPIAAGDPKYYIGYMVEGGIQAIPNAPVGTTPMYYAHTARPTGFKKQKKAIWNTPLVVKSHALDAVGLYLGHGKAIVNAGDPDYTISLSEDGDTPDVTWHEEHNKFGAADQAREYYKSKCFKCEVGFDGDFLAVTNHFALQREYDMTTDGVVRTTVRPSRRGDASPLFRYPRVHPSLNLTWHTSSFDKELSGDHSTAAKRSLFQNFQYTIETPMALDPEEDGLDYLPELQPRGKWELGPVSFDLLMDATSTIIDDLRLLKDGSTGSASTDYIMLTLPRLIATDYLSFKFKQAIIHNVVVSQNEAQAKSGTAMVKLIMQNYSDVEIVERQRTAADVSAINAAATYEL